MAAAPNLLFVFSDQHRWCDLGCAGNDEVISPNLDTFAETGIRFNAAYSNCPLCVPARGTLLTGLHALKHRAIANDLPIDPSVESLGTRLKAAGYRTGYVGKWHLAGIPRDQAVEAPDRLGFDDWKVRQCRHDYLNPAYHDEDNQLHVCEGYEPEIHTDLALDFLEGQTGEQPWSLVLSWGPPHEPYKDVPAKYRDRFDPEKLTLRENVPLPPEPFPGPGDVGESGLREWLAGYYAHIMALDEQFGRMVAQLKASGQWDNTIVIYTSDHGDLLGSHNMIFKQMPHEESSHIPLIVGGGLSTLGKGECNGLIGLVDLVPTLLACLGIEFDPASMDGTDLSRLFADPRAEGLDAVYLYSLLPCHYAAKRGDPAWRAIRTKEHTYAVDTDTSREWLLFDNKKDPRQLQNLMEGPHDVDVAALRDQLFRFVDEYDANCPWPELLQREGLIEEWNRSQRHFNMPELPA